ncbi:MAG TPA: hypothetical protein VN241_02660 [Microbacterium sp.]|nr:hypothetical protein [Microbacterium sp.]
MAVFTNAARRRVDRISAIVGGIAFVLGLIAVTIGAFAPVSGPSSVSSTMVSSPIPIAPTTQTVETTVPASNATRAPRVTTEVTITEETLAGEYVVTTTPVAAAEPFLGSKVASVTFQVLLVALLALLLAFATQRVLLGEYGIRKPVFATGEPAEDLIGSDEVGDIKAEVVSAGEQRDATRPLFDAAGVPDPRLRLLQSRIALEQEVRKLAQESEVPSNLSMPAVVKGLVEKKRMTPKLAGAVVALSGFGDRLSRGADLSVDTMTTLTEAYAQALSKVGGKIRDNK